MSPLTPPEKPRFETGIPSLLLALCTGIFFAQRHTSILFPLSLLLIGIVFIFVFLKTYHSLRLIYQANLGLRASLLLCFLSLGMITSILNRPVMSLPATDKYGNTRGYVESVVSKANSDFVIISLLHPDNSPSGSKAIMYINGIELFSGDLISCRGTLYPIVPETEAEESAYNNYLRQQGVSWRLKCNRKDIKVIGDISTPRVMADHIRTRLEIMIENTGLSKATSSFLITILLGDKTYLDHNSRTTFSDAGVSHILALSGMHIGIIVLILMSLFFPLNFTGRYKLRYYLTFVALWCYAFITGFSPTIVRATLMTSLSFLAILMQRKHSSFNALCLATLLILIFTPSALFTISLQLSFLCVASIIVFATRLNTVKQSDHPFLYKLNTLIICSLITTFTTWMLTAHTFGTVPLLFMPANIIILPLLPFYMTFAIIYILLSAIGLNIHFLGSIIDGGYRLMISTLDFISGHGEAVVHVTPSLSAVILWLLGITIMGIALESNRFKKHLTIGAISTMFLSITLI